MLDVRSGVATPRVLSAAMTATSPSARVQLRAHAVLGMHRSGTSWLAGSLQEKGLALGTVNESAPYNRKGNRENDDIHRLHDALMQESGGSWTRPPKRVQCTDRLRREMRTFAETMNAQYPKWGFKDPRTLLVLSCWKHVIPEGIALVGIFRHPEAVARSIGERNFNPLPHRDGIALWRFYNERLVDEHRQHAFPILRFDGPPDELQRGLDHVARAWGLPNAGAPSTFFEQELVHECAPREVAVPRNCRATWTYLVEHALHV